MIPLNQSVFIDFFHKPLDNIDSVLHISYVYVEASIPGVNYLKTSALFLYIGLSRSVAEINIINRVYKEVNLCLFYETRSRKRQQ